MADRLPLMAGNWKMNLNHVEATGVVQKLAWTLQDKRYDPTKAEVAVIVPYTDLRTVQTLVEGDKLPISYGAQDVSVHVSGAYTGEISVDMLAKLKCKYVVLGHSERRQYHGETDIIVNRKAQRVFRAGMVPIICVGEEWESRRKEGHIPFVLEQLRWCLTDLEDEWMRKLVIAYEPVWAIGSGQVASPEDAQDMCLAIRSYVATHFTQEIADQLRVLYGGSVKANNIRDIMAQPDVDGALVGGASLDPEEFAKIVLFYQEA
nr:triose-phosphate isomerase [Propionibacterium sp.]